MASSTSSSVKTYDVYWINAPEERSEDLRIRCEKPSADFDWLLDAIKIKVHDSRKICHVGVGEFNIEDLDKKSIDYYISTERLSLITEDVKPDEVETRGKQFIDPTRTVATRLMKGGPTRFTLTLGCKCMNPKCEDYYHQHNNTKLVSVELHDLQIFDLIQDQIPRCPACHHQNLQPVTCGFSRMEWTYRAKKVNDDTIYQPAAPIKERKSMMFEFDAMNTDLHDWESFKIFMTSLHPLCSICLGDMRKDGETFTTKCGHQFHKKCINKWKDTTYGHLCPNCRCPIK
jgi:hypothetical protein